MKYNHLGIPTTSSFEGEIDLPHLKMTVSCISIFAGMSRLRVTVSVPNRLYLTHLFHRYLSNWAKPIHTTRCVLCFASPIFAMIPALNSTRSASTPSLKIVPPEAILEVTISGLSCVITP